MKTFKQLKEELILLEVLDSKFNTNRDSDAEKQINSYLGDKIHKGHTAIMQSDHMKDNNHSVLRLMNKNKEIEYHFLDNSGNDFNDHKIDNKSMLHAMKIIHDDSKSYLNRGNTIKFQARTKEQHDNYNSFAKKLLDRHNIKDRKVIDKGETPRLDTGELARTTIIEANTSNPVNWGKLIYEAKLTKISNSTGSNPGGRYKDSDTGEEYFIKHSENPDQGKVEELSSKIHSMMGINNLEPRHKDGKVISKFNPHLENVKSKHIKDFSDDDHKHVGKLYAAGVLTKNWDAMGSGIDYDQGNLYRDKKSNKLVSGDMGGSFHFRAQGGHKDYDPDIKEKDSLLDPKMSEGAKFFNTSLNHPGVKDHVKQTLRNLDMHKVKKAFDDSGLKNSDDLHKNFIERHKKLLDHFEKS